MHDLLWAQKTIEALQKQIDQYKFEFEHLRSAHGKLQTKHRKLMAELEQICRPTITT